MKLMPLKLTIKKLLSYTVILLPLIFSSCSSVPEVPICAEISMSKGICTYTVSGKNIVVDDEHPLDGKTWFSIRVESLVVPASSWAKLKAFLIKQCKKTKKCDVDIASWDREINPN